MGHDGDHFKPSDALKAGILGGALGGGIGLTTAATMGALAKENIGVFGALYRGGLLVSGLGATGGATLFFTAVSSNLREQNDWKNWAFGGFTGGALQGLIARSIPKVFGFGVSFAVVMGLTDYTGGFIGHNRIRTNPDEYEEKEFARRNRRQPIEETLVNIGEGRGIKPPGYEERRARRLKEKYGIEINTFPAIAVDSE